MAQERGQGDFGKKKKKVDGRKIHGREKAVRKQSKLTDETRMACE